MDPAPLLYLSFLAGVYAPLGSPCVLILYPGYIAFLAGGHGEGRGGPSPLSLGIAVAAGVIVSMAAGGILFTGILSLLGGGARELITAGLFVLLFVFSLFLILDIDYERYIGTVPVPGAKQPLSAAFLLGITFGFIILPCNAAAIAVLLALASTASGFSEGIGSFLCFGLGITLPLILIASLSQARNRQIAGFLNRNSRAIRLISGLVMLAISLWYLALLFVPGVFS